MAVAAIKLMFERDVEKVAAFVFTVSLLAAMGDF